MHFNVQSILRCDLKHLTISNESILLVYTVIPDHAVKVAFSAIGELLGYTVSLSLLGKLKLKCTSE